MICNCISVYSSSDSEEDWHTTQTWLGWESATTSRNLGYGYTSWWKHRAAASSVYPLPVIQSVFSKGIAKTPRCHSSCGQIKKIIRSQAVSWSNGICWRGRITSWNNHSITWPNKENLFKTNAIVVILHFSDSVLFIISCLREVRLLAMLNKTVLVKNNSH